MRRGNRDNGQSVKGPTSALTSFLREKGIRVPRGASRFTAMTPDMLQAENEPTQTPPVSLDAAFQDDPPQETLENIHETISSNRITSHSVDITGNNSSVEDTPSTEMITVPIKTTKKTTKKKKKNPSDDDSDFDTPLHPDFSTSKVAPRFLHSKRRKINDENEDPSSKYIRFCQQCQRKFTVHEESAVLCDACIQFPSASKGVKSTKTKRLKKMLKVDQLESSQVMSLKSLCINLIVQYIDDVEAFGEISNAVKDKISQILSRHRQLNANTMKLFLSASEDVLALYDCSYLNEDELNMVAALCPNLRQLRLSYCGKLLDEVVYRYAESFNYLQSLRLGGCFLVTDKAFSVLFEKIGSALETVHLQEAAKFSLQGMMSLSLHTRLSSLTLKRCHAVDTASLQVIKSFKGLTKLKLIELDDNLDMDVLCDVIDSVKHGLSVLTLSGFTTLPDRMLESIQSMNQLTELSLKNAFSLTNEALVSFFEKWKPHQLTKLNLSGMVQLNDAVVHQMIQCCGSTLETLKLNQCDELSVAAFDLINQDVSINGPRFPLLKHLDVSWIRAVDDELFKRAVDHSPILKSLSIYGCNRISRICLEMDWRNAHGERLMIQGNEFD